MNELAKSKAKVGAGAGARYPFAMVELPKARSREKPRKSGRTMMCDWGLTLEHQQALLELAGDYIDLAKITVGTSRLYREDYLRAKLALYKEHKVRPFLGGQFQEYVYATMGKQALRPFLDEAKRVGFEVVEISDNIVPLSSDERRQQILIGREIGLTVLGEVGSKNDRSDITTLVAQAKDAFAAGAELVLVEAAELVESGKPNMAMFDGLRKSLDMTQVLIELPGPWISGVHACDIHDLKKMLVREFGPDVNLANVHHEDVLETEALRVGLSVVGPKTAKAPA
jgi:phosphosulfolactate synthase